jgi:hypothetical protein
MLIILLALSADWVVSPQVLRRLTGWAYAGFIFDDQSRAQHCKETTEEEVYALDFTGNIKRRFRGT